VIIKASGTHAELSNLQHSEITQLPAILVVADGSFSLKTCLLHTEWVKQLQLQKCCNKLDIFDGTNRVINITVTKGSVNLKFMSKKRTVVMLNERSDKMNTRRTE
jgi:hypothetical protein